MMGMMMMMMIDDDDNNDDGDHGNEVGDEDVVARVREICPQVCRTELGH